jgi:hypothetical protein
VDGYGEEFAATIKGARTQGKVAVADGRRDLNNSDRYQHRALSEHEYAKLLNFLGAGWG